MTVLTAISFLFLAIFGRFFFVQVVDGAKLRQKAVGQWTREIPVIAGRGKIFDRNGIVLAGNNSTYSVFVRPNAVIDAEKTTKVLSDLFSLDERDLYQKLTKSHVSEITAVRRAEKEKMIELERSGLKGVYYARDNTRVYPYGNLLSRIIGFTSSDGMGLTGLEKYYDRYLRGKNGELSCPTDLVGKEIEGKATYKPATDGLDIYLTIDYSIQTLAEEIAEKLYREHSPVNAQILVLNPNNFEILAMAEAPSYDLNDVPRDDAELLNRLTRNNIVSDIYEPGSTFKIITAAADIEEYMRGNPKAFSMQYRFNSSRTRTVDGTKIKCWSDHSNGKHSNQTLAEALNNSCNPCFTDIALALGKEKFYEYLKLFNFGTTTGVDFSGEAQGMVRTESAVRDCDLARIGFGQTVAVTALQLACAGASAINGGFYYQPRFVREIHCSQQNVSEKMQPILKNRTISREASKKLATLLEGVVEKGSGHKAYIEGYKVAGKTGTAQKFKNGSIAQGKYVASFLGFFPSDNPQYLALIIVDEPQGVYYGSAVAAPAASELFQGIISLKNINTTDL